MSSNSFLLLYCKKVSGDATAEELLWLEEMQKNDLELKNQYNLLEQYWAHHDHVSNIQVEEALQKVLIQVQLSKSEINYNSKPVAAPPGKKIFLGVITWATGLAAVLLVVLFIKQNQSAHTIMADNHRLEKKQNSKGTKSIIELADGSKIWLNADSKIEYPSAFEGTTREVSLNGEAYFEVAKNPEKPFIIHLANGTVRVLGTSFNIKAYDNKSNVETSVLTGKVAFIPAYKNSKKIRDTIFILPDNKLSYIPKTGLIAVQHTKAKDDKAWTEGKLIFKAMRLEDIAIDLERNFGKKVFFKEDALKEYILTGTFSNNTLEEIMFYLSKTKGFVYKINDNEMIIASSAQSL